MSKNRKLFLEENIGKLIVRQSIPAGVGMLVMSLYNVVDTIFIGRGVGALALAGVSLAFPLQMFIMAISQMMGVGASSIISRSLGAKDDEKARKILGNFFITLLILSVLITLISFMFLNPLLEIFGSTPHIHDYAYEYISIILIGTIFLMFSAASNNIIRAEGYAKRAMFAMMVSAILNIILDPIFIFVFDMGVKGAAIATVISQIAAAIYVIYYFFSEKNSIRTTLEDFKLKVTLVKEMFVIGFSTFTRLISAVLMTIILNKSLVFYGGELAVAAFGIIMRTQMIVLMPLFGIVQGMQPVLGFNYGAKMYGRAKESIVIAIKYATVLSVIAFIFIMSFTENIVSLFTIETDFISMTTHAILIIAILFPFIGFQIIGSGLYQTLGKARPALVLSLLRQAIILVPLVLILGPIFGLNGIWYSFPIADAIAGIITFIMIRKEINLLASNI